MIRYLCTLWWKKADQVEDKNREQQVSGYSDRHGIPGFDLILKIISGIIFTVEILKIHASKNAK